MTPPDRLPGHSLPPASGGPARQIVLLLHGYGSNGADLIGLAPQWRHALPDALFWAPDAPERCPGVPGGYQWWGLSSFSREALAAGTARAAPALDAAIDAALASHGLTERDLVLVGFSQGTMMALHVGPRRERAIAGIVGYSGMLTDPERLARERRSSPDVLLVHGAIDSVVPVAALHAAESALRHLGFSVEAHVVPGLDHGVDPTGLALGEAFVRRVLHR